jgi:hypothetical protein
MLVREQKEGWTVGALGNVFGGTVLIMTREVGREYEHNVIQLFWRLRGNLWQMIQEQQQKGWEVCAIGDCLGSAVVIFRRPVSSAL